MTTAQDTPESDTPEAEGPGCGCLCYSVHPQSRDRCLHVGQVPVTVLAARAGRSFPTRVRVCGFCAEILSSHQAPAAEPAI